MTNRTVMLTLDGTKFAATAIDETRYLATSLGARVVLLEVLRQHTGPSPFSIEGARQADRRDAQSHLRRAKQRLNLACVREVKALKVTDRSPGEAIQRSARDFDCDFVVTATHGRSGVSRMLRGSVAEHVARRYDGGSVVLVPQAPSTHP